MRELVLVLLALPGVPVRRNFKVSVAINMQLPLPARLHEMLYVLLRTGAKYEGAGFSHTRFSLFDAGAGIIHWIDVCSCNSFL